MIDLIAFIKRFMNPAASHLASRIALGGVVQNRRLLQKGWWNKKVISKRKEWVLWDKDLFLGLGGEWAVVRKGLYLSDYLSFLWGGVREWRGPRQITSLVSWALTQVMPFCACGILFNVSNLHVGTESVLTRFNDYP